MTLNPFRWIREEWQRGTEAKRQALALRELAEMARANNRVLSASLMELRELADEYGINTERSS